MQCPGRSLVPTMYAAFCCGGRRGCKVQTQAGRWSAHAEELLQRSCPCTHRERRCRRRSSSGTAVDAKPSRQRGPSRPPPTAPLSRHTLSHSPLPAQDSHAASRSRQSGKLMSTWGGGKKKGEGRRRNGTSGARAGGGTGRQAAAGGAALAPARPTQHPAVRRSIRGPAPAPSSSSPSAPASSAGCSAAARRPWRSGPHAPAAGSVTRAGGAGRQGGVSSGQASQHMPCLCCCGA